MGNTGSGEEWLEEVVMQLSPNMVQMIKDVLHKEVEPAIDKDMSEDGEKSGKFRFTKLDLGSEKPKWTNVSVHKSKEDGRRIVIDFDFVYNGDCDIEVKILGITSGVSTITMEGRARLILSPIVKRMPLVGGMQFQFLSLPTIGYQFDGIADLADLPGVKSKIRRGLEKKIMKKIVYPNRVSLALSDRSDTLLVHTLPVTGLLGVRISVEDLPSKGGLRKVLKQGDPDVFCKIRIGGIEKVTSVVKNCSSAGWEEWFQFPVEIMKGHRLEVQVWDEDSLSRDDFLGYVVVKIDEDIITEDPVTYNLEPHPFKKSKNEISGIVNLQSRWLPLTAEQSEEDTDNEIAVVLSAFAYKLNGVGAASDDSKIKIKISVGEQVQKSKKLAKGDDFEIMERFCFFLGSDWMEIPLTVQCVKNKSVSGGIMIDMGEIMENIGEKKVYDFEGSEEGESISIIFHGKFIQM